MLARHRCNIICSLVRPLHQLIPYIFRIAAIAVVLKPLAPRHIECDAVATQETTRHFHHIPIRINSHHLTFKLIHLTIGPLISRSSYGSHIETVNHSNYRISSSKGFQRFSISTQDCYITQNNHRRHRVFICQDHI